ncbi:hypothetical protein B7R54_08125 [Subtercola boreus]|uniref:HTH tetR-type domain-containing protein n=1 Tax=Subtercola boreus TaxID=120213 RepID=A0A3E0VGX0_9MICO|nr:TetR/AcrR family transcriptional regulator [Subtercola boreus]RFA09196.1 hypothetical protein B7R54_08125 [Subtercola boreus]TQL53784.1 TetR family transcriptional regulator [Subtercola boreus]
MQTTADAETTTGVAEGEEPESGVGARQRRTSRLLTSRARELTVENGLAGFTVQRLCDEVGVSRRTFFNYFSAKEDAVLGVARGADDDHVRAFMAARSGDLVTDLADLAVEAFAELALTAEDLETFRTILDREPALLAILLRSAQTQQERFVAMVAEREELGSDRVTAEVAVKLVGGLVSLSAEGFFAPGNLLPFSEILESRLAAASVLLTRLRSKDLVYTP